MVIVECSELYDVNQVSSVHDAPPHYTTETCIIVKFAFRLKLLHGLDGLCFANKTQKLRVEEIYLLDIRRKILCSICGYKDNLDPSSWKLPTIHNPIVMMYT